jgi:hypothetical protein
MDYSLTGSRVLACLWYFTIVKQNSREAAHPVFEVWQFGRTKFEYATVKDAVTQSLHKMARYVQYGNRTLDFAPEFRQISQAIPSVSKTWWAYRNILWIGEYYWCAILDSEWETSNQIVDIGCRWTAFSQINRFDLSEAWPPDKRQYDWGLTVIWTIARQRPNDRLRDDLLSYSRSFYELFVSHAGSKRNRLRLTIFVCTCLLPMPCDQSILKSEIIQSLQRDQNIT